MKSRGRKKEVLLLSRQQTLLIYFFMLLFILLSPPLFAQERKREIWDIAPEVSYIHYEEPGVMEQKGIMTAIVGSYTYYDYSNFVFGGEGRYAYGKMDYSSSSSGSMKDIDDYIWEVRGWGGYQIFISQQVNILPYIGLGYRYLNDDMSGRTTSTGAWGYEREISYTYTPVGIKVSSKIDEETGMQMCLEYDYFWKGNVQSHLADVPGYYDIENEQDKGYGCRGNIEFYRKAEEVEYRLRCFIRYWSIEDSQSTTDPLGITWIEPENNSTEYGVGFTLRF